MLGSWAPVRQLSVRDEMSDWSLDKLGHCVFGDDLTQLSEAIRNQFRQTIRQTLAAMVDIEAETPKPSAKERFQ
ncbi:hypothetical protein GCM10017744_092110 [Streptomyces antimycoticus]|uniref:Uncharacterized protein n=1 Tax=Streptomyces antimycoticus TaxID=68175 RepID=A0A4D4JYP5_9ACTN|nr:hypothetical protein SANT12839_004100 [Streptomyces antimycoticus]